MEAFIVFVSMIKILECIWIYAADLISRQHFYDKTYGNGRVRLVYFVNSDKSADSEILI